MKNILLITSLYPSNDVAFLNNTAVCHYFAKEWVKLGYNVRVVYSYRIYPFYYYPVLKLFGKILAKTQASAILDKRLNKLYSYTIDGVRVDRVPIKKSRPHGDFKQNELQHHCRQIHHLLSGDDFIPDVILGHFYSPALDIVTLLKDCYYSNAKIAVSMHGQGKDRGYNKEDKLKFSKLDYIGYRSYAIKMSYEQMYGKMPFFICPSGVPENYITKKTKDFTSGVTNYIFVGSFMDRKHPSVIVEALATALKDNEYTLTFVGDGAGKDKIIKTAIAYDILHKIRFTGRLSRDQVTNEMDQADVFIMVSENETFGLVYLEAMARGCITIASRNEGMDGFIVDGQNGFLCKAGDAEELSCVINKIMQISSDELSQISQNAIDMAKQMTDKKVALEYIKVFDN